MSQLKEAVGDHRTEEYAQRWRALGLLSAAQFMLILDVTVVAIALPQLGADLGMQREALTWVVSAYTLVFGGLMLTGGRLADTVGARLVVVTGLAIFTVSSLLAGLAATSTVILAARAGQGVGAALMSPAALSLVVNVFESDERDRALGIWSALGGVGAAVGVLLGGVITAGPGWQWVFLLNVPVGAALLVVLPRVLPVPPRAKPRARLDIVGALLGMAATGLLIYAFISAGNTGWGSSRVVAPFAAGALLLLILGRWVRSRRDPLVDPALVTRRPVIAGSFVLFIGTGLMVAVFFLGTFFFQQVAAYGPLSTGLLFLPVAVSTMLGAQVAGRALSHFGPRRLAVAGLLIATAGLLIAPTGGGTLTIVIGMAVASLGLGSLFVVASVTALTSVEPHQAGVASGLLSTFHEVGASMGAAVMSGVVAASLSAGTFDGFARGYVSAAGIAAASAAMCWVLLRERSDTGSPPTPGGSHRSWRAFLRHYVEMVIAMFLGMVLYPLWGLVTEAWQIAWLQRIEVESLAMATAMSIPMAAWMVRRGHRASLTVEMVVAMFGGFLVLFPLLWNGLISSRGVTEAGHVLMLLFMLAAMLIRRHEYMHHH